MTEPKTIVDPQAYQECPFCGASVDEENLNPDAQYADAKIYVDTYICPECHAECQVRYEYADTTWTPARQ